jgi:hypothetical protein
LGLLSVSGLIWFFFDVFLFDLLLTVLGLFKEDVLIFE